MDHILLVEQEGWLSPTERASVSAISLRHILASPGYAPGTIALNVTWMKRGFNACQTHRSMYPSTFNCFAVIQPISSKVRHFSTFLHCLAYPGYAPGKIVVNVTWMERGVSAGHSSIYPSIFHLRAIARYWSEIATFSYLLAFIGGVPIGNPGKSLDLRKLESWGYEAVKIG